MSTALLHVLTYLWDLIALFWLFETLGKELSLVFGAFGCLEISEFKITALFISTKHNYFEVVIKCSM